MSQPPAIAAPASLWRDFLYYATWWLFWAALSAILQPLDVPDAVFWQTKVSQLIVGLVYGLFLAVTFTLAQNAMNKARRRPLSWLFAIITAILWAFVVLVVSASPS